MGGGEDGNPWIKRPRPNNQYLWAGVELDWYSQTDTTTGMGMYFKLDTDTCHWVYWFDQYWSNSTWGGGGWIGRGGFENCMDIPPSESLISVIAWMPVPIRDLLPLVYTRMLLLHGVDSILLLLFASCIYILHPTHRNPTLTGWLCYY